MNEEKLKEIVRMVLESLEEQQTFEREVDSSGVMVVRTDSVVPERFDTGNPNDQVWLKDVLTLEESPRLGAGIMEMKETTFEWTLQYDEIDYIIDGSLSILIGDQAITGRAGDLIYIPCGSTICFSAHEFARFVYITYPADWQQS